jgi:hypothetical protein
MICIYPDYKGNLRVGNIEVFLDASIDNYIKVRNNNLEFSELYEEKTAIASSVDGEVIELPGLRNINRLFELQRESDKLTIQGIILATTFLEALINEIGIVELGSKYFKEHLDKLTMLSKWDIVLKLVYGKSIKKEGHYFEGIVNLVKARNELVHYKTIQQDNNREASDYFKVLEKYFKCLPLFICELRKIDSEKEILEFITIEKQLERIINS